MDMDGDGTLTRSEVMTACADWFHCHIPERDLAYICEALVSRKEERKTHEEEAEEEADCGGEGGEGSETDRLFANPLEKIEGEKAAKGGNPSSSSPSSSSSSPSSATFTFTPTDAADPGDDEVEVGTMEDFRKMLHSDIAPLPIVGEHEGGISRQVCERFDHWYARREAL